MHACLTWTLIHKWQDEVCFLDLSVSPAYVLRHNIWCKSLVHHCRILLCSVLFTSVRAAPVRKTPLTSHWVTWNGKNIWSSANQFRVLHPICNLCVCLHICLLFIDYSIPLDGFIFSCSMRGTNRGHQSHWPLKICSSSLFKIWLLQSSDLILHTASVCQKMIL